MAKYFSSDEALSKMKRFFSFEYDLLRHGIGYLPLMPRYADKCTFSRHVYEDLKRSRSIRERVQDFGIPNPDKQLDAAWTNIVKRLLQAPNADYFIAALYRVIKPAQAEAYRTYANNTLRLNDAPSVEALEDHLPALDRQIAWGKHYMEHGYVSAKDEHEIEKFEAEIQSYIDALGGLYAGAPAESAAAIEQFEAYTVPQKMLLESRFIWHSAERIFESGEVNSEEHPAHHSYSHFTELPIIDLCATIVYDGRHLGFDYIADFVRQTWDEVRHSQMGFSRLLAMGFDPYVVAIPVGHYEAYTSLPLIERIAALTQVGEACSFVPKKQWTKMAKDHNDLLTALEHDFDIVDEKNHVKFGARWLKELIIKNKETRDFKQVIQDSEWNVRLVLNEIKKEKGEKWAADGELGPRFDGCQVTGSPLNLAPHIIIA